MRHSHAAARRRGPRHALTAAFLAAALLVLATASPGQQGPNAHGRGYVLVKFRPSAALEGWEKALARIGARGVRQIGRLPVHAVFLPPGLAERAAVEALRKEGAVEFAELDMVRAPVTTPNDPVFPSQWHLPNISAPLAWDQTVGDSGVVVAVLDTGCDPTHADLAANYVPGWNFYDNNSNTADVYGHGTSVAGCVGAVSNNGTGVASVSWLSRIMPCRVSSPTGGAYDSTIATALQWAADRGARIANISYGDLPSSYTVIEAARYMYGKGGLTVVSAGNTGTNLGYSPSPYLIAVSATNSGNAKTSWSSYGPYVTVAAPGEGIATTANGGGYRTVSGTSFSAPITCGVLALAWAANPSLSNAQVQQALVSSAKDLGAAGRDDLYGYGKVDAFGAVLAARSIAADTTPPSVAVAEPVAGSRVEGTVTIGVQASDDTAVARVEVYVDGKLHATLTSAPYAVAWNTMGVANGAHTLSAKAYDASGNAGVSASCPVTVANAGDTQAPACAITSPSDGAVAGAKLTVKVSASDNVGVTQIQLWVDGMQAASSTACPASFTLNTRKWAAGRHALQAFALDAAGNRGASAIVTVTK